MSFFSSLKSMFSVAGAAKIKADPVEYKGYTILPTPEEEQGQYRISAQISKADKVHQFIRCDLVMNLDECISVTIYKAKMTIDQQGDSIFTH